MLYGAFNIFLSFFSALFPNLARTTVCLRPWLARLALLCSAAISQTVPWCLRAAYVTTKKRRIPEAESGSSSNRNDLKEPLLPLSHSGPLWRFWVLRFFLYSGIPVPFPPLTQRPFIQQWHHRWRFEWGERKGKKWKTLDQMWGVLNFLLVRKRHTLLHDKDFLNKESPYLRNSPALYFLYCCRPWLQK